MLLSAGLMTSTDLWLRSAKKYLWSTGSTQLMSKETSGVVSTCIAVEPLNISSLFGPSPLQAAPAKANAATAPIAGVNHNLPLDTRRDDERIANLPVFTVEVVCTRLFETVNDS
jgi:hypothetical protein